MDLISLVVFLTACSHYENYAPVYINNPDNTDTLKEVLHAASQTEHPTSSKVNKLITQKSVKEKDPVVKFNLKSSPSVTVSEQKLAEKHNVSAKSVSNLSQKREMSNVDPKTIIRHHQKDIRSVKNIQEKSPSFANANAVLKKPRIAETDAKKTKNKQKSSIISIDNKKMLKLNFQWPVRGKVLRNFTQTRNKGIDIAGKIGQKIVAASGGKVVYSGQGLIGFGKLLIIKHNSEYLSAYANVGKTEVSEGQLIKKGQLIAKIGRAGSKRTSLHFEIRKNGKPVNPIKYLP